MISRIVLSLLVLSLTACAHTVERHDWSGYQGPGAAHFQAEELPLPTVADPIEPANRSIWAMNDVLMRYAIDPLARGYVFITPSWFRAGLQNFGANWVYPRRVVNNLLQAKWRGALDETNRFAVNTTLGVAGLVDVAQLWLEIDPSDEDFGQTMSTWGWKDSTYVMLPFSGPSTVRDTVGLLPDTALNLATYAPVPLMSAFLAFNNGAEHTKAYKQFVLTHDDSYQLARIGWTLAREEVSTDFTYSPEDTARVQSLKALFLDVRDPKYRSEVDTGEVFLPETGEEFPYSYRLQEDPAPILFVIPGTGGHRLEGSPLALSEMAWNRGFSVVILSSTLNFEFMDKGATVALPGHAPADAHDTHVALDAIYRDLEAEYPGQLRERALMGYSLGAFHTFYIAAAEADPENTLIDFDRYVTLDSPVNLVHGLKKLDSFYNAPLAFPPEQRDHEVRKILHKALHLAKNGFAIQPSAEADSDAAQKEQSQNEDLGSTKPIEEDIARLALMDVANASMTPTGPLPFTNLEAEFLIGLAFRITLSTAIYVSQDREDVGVLKTERSWFRRASAYEEISEYSYLEYIYGFLMPYYRNTLGVESTIEELLYQNDLRSIADRLRGHPKIRHFSNRNDFLTTDEDIIWLTELLGEPNVRFYAEGGHLGNMYRPEVQAEVMSSLMDLVQ